MSRVLSAASAALLAGAATLSHPYGTVTIACRHPGMRRCGAEHPATETYPFGRWTPDELARLEADPAFDVRYDMESRSAPGADTADAVQDQGAGAPTPDLGAKPDGTGPSAPMLRADSTFVPAVLDASRVDAIRGRLADLAAFMAPADADALLAADFSSLGDEQWIEAESMLGFRPTPAEMNAAVVSAFFRAARLREVGSRGRWPLASSPESIAGADGDRMEATEKQAVLDRLEELRSAPASAFKVPDPIDFVTAETAGVSSAAPPVDRAEAIRAAVAKLVMPGDFTAGGKPKLEALEALLGFSLVRADVEAAMKTAPSEIV